MGLGNVEKRNGCNWGPGSGYGLRVDGMGGGGGGEGVSERPTKQTAL